MNELFRALSELNSELASPEVRAPLEPAAPEAVAPAIAPKQPVKAEHHSLKVVQPTLGQLALAPPEAVDEGGGMKEATRKPAEPVEIPAVMASASPESRLVTLTDPNSLGAEKFRALVTRFDHLRNQREFKSFQVTSSVIGEGKTLVAANVAVTLARYSGSKTLLVEGDLHRPSLASLFGLGELRGLHHWWSGQEAELGKFVYRLKGMPLWILPAGKACDQPSDLLRSTRFVKAFTQLAGQFEWTVVDSTPMSPIVDVNLWSRLLQGTLLVVREGVAPVQALKRGLQALDHPKLIGVVVNEAAEFERDAAYAGQYYGKAKRGH